MDENSGYTCLLELIFQSQRHNALDCSWNGASLWPPVSAPGPDKNGLPQTHDLAKILPKWVSKENKNFSKRWSKKRKVSKLHAHTCFPTSFLPAPDPAFLLKKGERDPWLHFLSTCSWTLYCKTVLSCLRFPIRLKKSGEKSKVDGNQIHIRGKKINKTPGWNVKTTTIEVFYSIMIFLFPNYPPPTPSYRSQVNIKPWVDIRLLAFNTGEYLKIWEYERGSGGERENQCCICEFTESHLWVCIINICIL